MEEKVKNCYACQGGGCPVCSGTGYLDLKYSVEPKIKYYNPNQYPAYSEDFEVSGYSVDVFIIDEDGMHGLAFYDFHDGEWSFLTDTLVDYNEIGCETKWKWYYPEANVKEAFQLN